MGSFFCTREIGSSLAFARNINANERRLEVTWLVPATKKDPMALGTS